MLFMGVTFAIGVLLRMQFVFPLEGFPFSYVVHAHSHVGFLGWVFNGFFLIAYKLFIVEEDEQWFRRLFWACQVGVIGMLVAFPLQGYALWSIVFSTIHLLCSMAFVIKLMQRNRAAPAAKFAMKLASVFLLLSSIGPFAMGPVMVTSLRDTIVHPLGIYYYLHFQYNAWFVFFLIAAALQTWALKGVGIELERVKGGLKLLAVAVVLTYAQSALWLDLWWIRLVAGVAGIMQLWALFRLARVFRPLGVLFESRMSVLLSKWAAALFLLKALFQLVAVVPALHALGEQHYVVIAFLHLMFLGVTTPLIWAWSLEFGLLRAGGALKAGVAIFGIGVFVSEAAIVSLPLFGFFSVTPVPFLFPIVFYASVSIFLGGLAVAFSTARPSS